MLPVQGDIESIVYGLIVGAGGAKIKSVQAGESTVPGGTTSIDVAITAVDLTRALVIITFGGVSAQQGPRDFFVRAELVSPTVLRLKRNLASGSSHRYVRWQVIEFASGVTVQQVTTVKTQLSHSIPISVVDPTRSIVVLSYETTESDTTMSAVSGLLIRAWVTTSTLELQSNSNSSETVTAFIVEVK